MCARVCVCVRARVRLCMHSDGAGGEQGEGGERKSECPATGLTGGVTGWKNLIFYTPVLFVNPHTPPVYFRARSFLYGSFTRLAHGVGSTEAVPGVSVYVHTDRTPYGVRTDNYYREVPSSVRGPAYRTDDRIFRKLSVRTYGFLSK